MASFTNLPRLKRKLLAYPPAVLARIRPAMAAVADEIVAMQKVLVPVERGGRPRRAPGSLHDSIGWVWGNVSRGISGALSAAQQAPNSLRLTFFAGDATAFYARFVEFGTHAGTKGTRRDQIRGNRVIRRKVLRTHPGSAARPFFFGPIRAFAGKAKDDIKAAVRAATRGIKNGS